jgi:DUF4097 and DUF4098 domain-containing protein YvlB
VWHLDGLGDLDMRQYGLLTTLVVAAGALTACGINSDVTATASGANTVNGSIDVPAGLHSGAVGTVNGSIHIGDNATVASAGTVNGSIELGAHAAADSLSTVNGGVTLGDGARVARAVTTVNGSMKLKSGAEVTGRVSNVNGQIALTDAHVAGGLRTVAGDIDITGASHVEGGIVVEKSTGWLNWDPRKPRIVIGPGAVVEGPLRFEREVRLYVSDKATVGPISGTTAIAFSGAQPPG